MSTCASKATSEYDSHGSLNLWAERWSKNNLGWHINEPHPALVKYLPTLLPQHETDGRKKSIFVPLCGKTVDMAYLAEHPNVEHVVGVEGIQKAIEEFGQENPKLNIYRSEDQQNNEKFDVYVGNSITLLKGNFFNFDLQSVPTQVSGQKFDVVWDRASIIAIDPRLRRDYVDTIKRIIKPGGIILLCTIDRRSGNADAMAAGPPFSVNESTVRELYEHEPWVEKVVFLGETDLMSTERDKWTKSGLISVFEAYFIIQTLSADSQFDIQ